MKKNLLCLIIFFSFIMNLNAQDYKLHSLFVYKFTQYIDFNKNIITIGVVGESEIYNNLLSLSKTKNNIIVKKITPNESSNVDIVFVSKQSSKYITTVNNLIKGHPILLISETTNGCSMGSCINFVVIDSRLKYEISKSKINEQKLKVSSDLINLGIIK